MANITINMKADAEITNMRQIKDIFKDFSDLGENIRDAIQKAFKDEPIEVTHDTGNVEGYFNEIKTMIFSTKALIRSMLPYVSPVSGRAGTQSIITKIEEVEQSLDKFDDKTLSQMIEGGRAAIEQIVDYAKLQLLKGAETGDMGDFKSVQRAMDILLAHFGKMAGVTSEFGPRRKGDKLRLSINTEKILKQFMTEGEDILQQAALDLFSDIMGDVVGKEGTMGGRTFLDISADYFSGGGTFLGASLKNIFAKNYSYMARGGAQATSYLGRLPVDVLSSMMNKLENITDEDTMAETIAQYYDKNVLAVIAEQFVGGQQTSLTSEYVTSMMEAAFKDQFKNMDISDTLRKVITDISFKWTGETAKTISMMKEGDPLASLGLTYISAAGGIESPETFQGVQQIDPSIADKLEQVVSRREELISRLSPEDRQMIEERFSAIVEAFGSVDNGLQLIRDMLSGGRIEEAISELERLQRGMPRR